MSNWILLQDHKTKDMWFGSAVNTYGTLQVKWDCRLESVGSLGDGPKSLTQPHFAWRGNVTVFAIPIRERLEHLHVHENSLLETILDRLGVKTTVDKDEIAKLRADHEQHTAGLWDRISGLSDQIADLEAVVAELQRQP